MTQSTVTYGADGKGGDVVAESFAPDAAGSQVRRVAGTDPRDPDPRPGVPSPYGVGPHPPVIADVDVLIERKDLGANAHTRVNAGQTIPAGLVDLPRAPA